MILPEPLRYESLVAEDTVSFEAFYKLFVDSMPENERKTKVQMIKMAKASQYNILLLKASDAIVGYSVCFLPKNEAFVLLEYMAIHADFRSQGLGYDLFVQTFQHIKKTNTYDYALLEVDSDLENSDDLEIRQRRQRFYRHLGCLRVNNLAYQLPMRGQLAPPKMDILIYPMFDFYTISKAQLKRWLNVIYVDVYNASEYDPRINQMLEPVADPITLA